MSTNHLMAVLALERCRFRLSHLCAVIHLGRPESAPDTDVLCDKTMMGLIGDIQRDLGLIEESLNDGGGATKS